MNTYYEISDAVRLNCTWYGRSFPGKVLVHDGDANLQLMSYANRVWRERGNEVRFLKNRFQDPILPVDMKEFMWIKLSANAIP